MDHDLLSYLVALRGRSRSSVPVLPPKREAEAAEGLCDGAKGNGDA
jgi:hypothetical protein